MHGWRKACSIMILQSMIYRNMTIRVTVFGWAKPVGMLDILRNSHRNSLLNPNWYLLHLSVSIVHQQFRRKASRPKLVASYLRIFPLWSQRLMANFKGAVEMDMYDVKWSRILPMDSTIKCGQWKVWAVFVDDDDDDDDDDDTRVMDVTLSWADTHV